MSIVNIMEDKIKSAVNEVLATREDRYLLVKYIEDIIAYVLNRVPPRYITSERGFIHNEIEFSINIQLQADIRFCIEDAIRTLLKRREPAFDSSFPKEILGKHYYFPYVIGEVLEETTFSIIPDIEVQLVYNDQLVPMIDTKWTNPYYTCNATKGFYLFWPDFIKEEMDAMRDTIFKLIFRHEKFYKKEIIFKLRALDNFSFSKSQVIPLTLLQLREGEAISIG